MSRPLQEEEQGSRHLALQLMPNVRRLFRTQTTVRDIPMIKVAIRKVRPEKEARLRDWLAELNDRAEEVRETFESETVRAEQAYIIPGQSGPLLVYIMEAADFERGAKAYAESTHKIDAEHRLVMQECLSESLSLAPLYDVSIR